MKEVKKKCLRPEGPKRVTPPASWRPGGPPKRACLIYKIVPGWLTDSLTDSLITLQPKRKGVEGWNLAWGLEIGRICAIRLDFGKFRKTAGKWRLENLAILKFAPITAKLGMLIFWGVPNDLENFLPGKWISRPRVGGKVENPKKIESNETRDLGRKSEKKFYVFLGFWKFTPNFPKWRPENWRLLKFGGILMKLGIWSLWVN